MQSVGGERVEIAGAPRAVLHQAGVLQDLEVLADGGPADRQLAGQFADGAGTVPQALQDAAPGGIAECIERGLGPLLVTHGQRLL